MHIRWICFAVSTLFAAAASANCDSLKTSIDAKLQAKHVENYSLEVRDASDSGDGKVIGHCEGDKKVIVYQRPAPKAGDATQ